MKNATLTLLSVALVLITITASLAAFLHVYYNRYEAMAEKVETTFNYNPSTANAIKHASAASDMFTLLRPILGDSAAEMVVIRFGVINEYIERIIYPDDRDPAREIMKDLHNNYAGILAAKLADENMDAFKIILSFSASSTLIVDRIYNPFFEGKEPKKNTVAFGYDWFNKHHAEIDERISMKINRAKDLRVLNLAQL